MKILFDFFPIILFFGAYKWAGIYVASGVAIGASMLQLAWSWFHNRKLEKMQVATLVLLLVSGGLTIGLKNQLFIMWKPTLVNWLFGMVFLGSQWVGERPLLHQMMGHVVEMPKSAWIRLNLAWVSFFFLLGVINLAVVYMPDGFYFAREALIAATGREDIDLKTCDTEFTGQVLELCNNAHAREEFWVNFKLFGMLGLTFLFVILQSFYLSRHLPEPEPEQE